MSKKTTVWQRTSVQNLLRHGRSGRYFGRWTVAGKQIWRKLDTNVFTVAKLRLNDEAAKIERRRACGTAVSSGNGTVGDFMEVYEDRTRKDPDLKPSSILARLVALKKIRKTWPELARLKASAVTEDAVVGWATRFKANGTAFSPPGAKTVIRGNSATSVNRAIDTLRRIKHGSVGWSQETGSSMDWRRMGFRLGNFLSNEQGENLAELVQFNQLESR
jgi:hypothetical protein